MEICEGCSYTSSHVLALTSNKSRANSLFSPLSRPPPSSFIMISFSISSPPPRRTAPGAPHSLWRLQLSPLRLLREDKPGKASYKGSVGAAPLQPSRLLLFLPNFAFHSSMLGAFSAAVLVSFAFSSRPAERHSSVSTYLPAARNASSQRCKLMEGSTVHMYKAAYERQGLGLSAFKRRRAEDSFACCNGGRASLHDDAGWELDCFLTHSI